MFDCHDASVSKQLLRVVVDELTIDEAVDVVTENHANFVLHLLLCVCMCEYIIVQILSITLQYKWVCVCVCVCVCVSVYCVCLYAYKEVGFYKPSLPVPAPLF